MNHRRFLKHFLSHQGILKGYLLAATGKLAEAEDLLQEVSSVLWETFDRYDETRPFRAWALGIARLEVLKWKQRRARRREVLLSDEAIQALADAAKEHAAEAEARRDHLNACVEKLAGKERAVIQMRYRDALPIRQVAEQSGRSVAAVEMLLVRIRRALRDCVMRRVNRVGEIQ